MKRLLLAVAALALLLPSAPRAEARVDVSIDFFYSNLSGGSWIDVGDYGYCWQPSVAVSDTRWRPYADGYWAYTDLGWTWVSYEDFGWATYHYGRWARLRDHGWVWVPGYEWGPAWVSWRTGGDYVGWAPLPPRRGYRHEVVYEPEPISGYVDIEFDIGPAYYNFVDVRYIGAPVLREHIYEPARNVTYINQTVNVTNITYNNATVYNYGPDYNTLSAYSTRPIQRLSLERQTPNDLRGAAQAGGLTRVQGDKLVVSAPQVVAKSEQPVAPPAVKTKVEQSNVETGWMGITDPNAKAQIQDKMKKEDRKKVPPPQIAPRNPEALNAAAPGPGAAPAAGTTTGPNAPDEAARGANAAKMDRNGRGKNKPDAAAPAAPGAQPQQADGSTPPQTGDATVAPAADDARGRGRDKDRRGRDRAQQPDAIQPADAAGGAGSVPAADSVAPGVRDSARGQGKRGGQSPASGIATDPAAANAPADAAPGAPPTADGTKPEKERGRGGNKDRQDRRRDENDAARVTPPEIQPQQPAPDRGLYAPNAGGPADQDAGGRGRGKVKREREDAPPQTAPAPNIAPPPQQERAREMMEERARGRRERQEAPPQMAPPPQAPTREIMQEGGRGRRERQEAPPQMAPPPQGGPAAGGPPPQPEGRGKPERKKKKDDGGPQEP